MNDKLVRRAAIRPVWRPGKMTSTGIYRGKRISWLRSLLSGLTSLRPGLRQLCRAIAPALGAPLLLMLDNDYLRSAFHNQP